MLGPEQPASWDEEMSLETMGYNNHVSKTHRQKERDWGDQPEVPTSRLQQTTVLMV